MGTETVQSRDEDTAVAALTLVARDLTRLFGSVQEVDWDRPTPCSEWTLRDLTEHITGGNRFTIRILSGDTSEDAMAAAVRSFAEDHDTRRSLVTSTFELEHASSLLARSTGPATISPATSPVTTSSVCDSTT